MSLIYPTLTPSDLLVRVAFFVSLVIQLFFIARFTPLWKRRSAGYKKQPVSDPIVSLLISNVKMSNRHYEKVISMIKREDPDIAIFMETDEKWVDALKEVIDAYAYTVKVPLDNGYGLTVASRFQFFDDQVRYLLNQEVPSFDAIVQHPDGAQFRLFVVHPEPPILASDTIGRDAEIAFVGKLVRHDDNPIIVTGDLNDVAWSRTTRRFLRVSRLLDPREGRGQFNTFDARYFFMRWPLDHIFHSPHFQLVSMKRMVSVNSDHFPMSYKLALTDQESGRREVDIATDVDIDEAEKLIAIEKTRDDPPNGADWEKNIESK